MHCFLAQLKLYCTYYFVFHFSSSPYNVIFLLKHLVLIPFRNSPRFILGRRQSDKNPWKRKAWKKREEESMGLKLLRNGFRLLVHDCENLDSIFSFFLYVFYILHINIQMVLLGSVCLSDCVWKTAEHFGKFSRNPILGRPKVNCCCFKLLKKDIIMVSRALECQMQRIEILQSNSP